MRYRQCLAVEWTIHDWSALAYWAISFFPFSEFLRFSLSFRLFSFALTDKAFGVDSEAIESIDAHWDYE